jgi:mannose/fructose/N-acetylgalactosamine-specific phosphotransferase system component IID
MSLPLALLFGFWYWLTMYDTILINWIGTPPMVGLICGLLWNNVMLGVTIAMQIELVYIVSVAVGANMPADKTLGAFVAIPIVLSQGLALEVGLALAVPFATLGPVLDNLRRMINGVWNRKAHKDVDNMNIKELYRDAWLYPALVQLPIRIIPLTAILFLGAGSAKTVLAFAPYWLTHGLAVVAGMLPALGMVACIRMIGRPKLMPYFIFGYFAMMVLKLPMILFAIFAGVAAYLSVGNIKSEEVGIFKKGSASKEPKEELQYALTKKELKQARFRGLFTHRISQCMEYFYGTGFCVAVEPALKKLFGHDEEKYKEALHRHLVPYITEVSWGACIQGAALAMEEQLANGADIDPNAITAMRTGLMGPFAGLGDTINYFVLGPIVRSIGISLALSGNIIIGLPIVVWFLALENLVFGYLSFDAGYRLGKESLLTILKGGWIEKLMSGFGVLGMLMMGALSFNYVKLSSVLKFSISGKEYLVQSFFDQIVPGLLPFALVMAGYFYMRTPKASFSKMMILLTIIGLLGSLIKFF